MSAIVQERKKTSSSNPLASIAELLASAGEIGESVSGKKVTTKQGATRQTQGLDISQAGVDKVLADILESTQGLAAVSSGQKTAGLYNSTTNQQLVNDLTSRTAGDVAKLQAQQVTTSAPSQSTEFTQPTADIGTTLTTALAGIAGKKLLDTVFDEGGIGGTILNAGTDLVGSVGSDLVSGVQGLFGSGSGLSFIDEAASGVSSAFSGIGDSLFGGMDFLGDSFSGFPILGTAMDFLSGEPEDALAGGAGFLIGNALLPGVGGILGTLASDILPFDDIFGGISDGVGGLLSGIGDIFGSVVCTELYRQGIMSKYYYTIDVLYAKHAMSKTTLDGYRYWGVPLVKLMRKSPRVTRLAAWFAVARAHYIVSTFPDGFYQAKLARRGKIINAIGVPLCNLLGRIVTPKDWTTLYPSAVTRKVG